MNLLESGSIRTSPRDGFFNMLDQLEETGKWATGLLGMTYIDPYCNIGLLSTWNDLGHPLDTQVIYLDHVGTLRPSKS